MTKGHKIIIIFLTAVILIMSTLAIFAARNGSFPESVLLPETPTPMPIPEETALTPEASPESIEVIRIRVEMESSEIARGTRFHPNVIIYPEDATDKRFELSSDNEDVIRRQGNYWVASDVGTAMLTAKATNGVTSSVLITVVLPPAAIYFPQDEMTLNRGDVLTLDFTRRDQWVQVYDPIVFTSSDENVATVAQDGTITAVDEGVATITVTIGESSATLEITVEVQVRAISIELSRNIFSTGERVEFSVHTTPDDPTDTSYTVSLSGAPVDNVQENSFVAAAAGEVVITVTAANGVYGTHTIVVHDLAAFAQEVFRLTNAERANHGLPAYIMDASLTQAAMVRASETIDYFSHTRPDGRHFATSFEEANVPQGRWGENLAAGQRSPEEAIEGWMGSQGHREAILDASYVYMGVGVVMDENGRLYWTQTFRG